jgi:hypothetical protein
VEHANAGEEYLEIEKNFEKGLFDHVKFFEFWHVPLISSGTESFYESPRAKRMSTEAFLVLLIHNTSSSFVFVFFDCLFDLARFLPF